MALAPGPQVLLPKYTMASLTVDETSELVRKEGTRTLPKLSLPEHLWRNVQTGSWGESDLPLNRKNGHYC